MKKIIVLSLGGSLIVPGKVDDEFLRGFKKVLLKHTKKYKFVVVCGGGSVARIYINGLGNQDIRNKDYLQSLLGVASTRINARFMTYFFGNEANKGIPHDMKEVKSLLRKNSVVFCGALRYAKHQTSDSTAAKLARYFSSKFINLTNIKGLYDKDPKKHRGAKFIPEISHKEFLKMARAIKFVPGQHFVLDQTAAKIINKYNIDTVILGSELKNLDNYLRNKHFIGTIIN